MNSSLNGFRGYVGIVDFGPGTDQSVIIASSPHKVRRDALQVIVITNPANGNGELNTTTDHEAPAFLTENPVTGLDIDDALALDLWYEDLAAAVAYPKLTIYGPTLTPSPGNAATGKPARRPAPGAPDPAPADQRPQTFPRRTLLAMNEAQTRQLTSDDGRNGSMSEELTPASCPDEGVAILQMCVLWKENGASEWQADFGHTTICIVSPGECEHRVTLCAECLDSWSDDHIVSLAPAGTPRPDIPEP